MNTAIPDGAHALLISTDGRVILEQKTADYKFNPLNANKLSMYGGGIEGQENPLDTLRRELKEELELQVESNSIQTLNTYKKNKEQDGAEVTVHVFLVTNIDPSTLTMPLSEHAEGSAPFVVDTAENFLENPNVSRITKLALQDYIRNLAR